MYKKCLTAAAVAATLFGAVQPGAAIAGGSNPFLGEIMWVPYNFAPAGWALCNGQLIAISSNAALFSLLGTYYGGNGTTNFALPDMQGRVAVNVGQASGLSNYDQGQSGGSETVSLTQSQMPLHTHSVNASDAVADQESPAGNLLAQAGSGSLYGTTPSTTMGAGAVGISGSGQAHNNMMPYTTLTCIIATAGVFPARP